MAENAHHDFERSVGQAAVLAARVASWSNMEPETRCSAKPAHAVRFVTEQDAASRFLACQQARSGNGSKLFWRYRANEVRHLDVLERTMRLE